MGRSEGDKYEVNSKNYDYALYIISTLRLDWKKHADLLLNQQLNFIRTNIMTWRSSIYLNDIAIDRPVRPMESNVVAEAIQLAQQNMVPIGWQYGATPDLKMSMAP